ncbi:MAG: chorismate-binding protein [Victivallales bacterium]|nr:chorismate-binding protein [Victivallales bacterium]
MKTGSVVCRLPDSKQWGVFTNPVKLLCCTKIEDVKHVLAELEEALSQGCYAAGFISYEAGAAFDKAFPACPLDDFPLLWFGIYDKAPDIFDSGTDEIFAVAEDLEPELSDKEYHDAISEVLEDIKHGNLYQTNFTFRLRGKSTNDPWRLFKALFIRHPMPYAAFINTGDSQIVSLSPEMFLERNGTNLFNSPMKGTIKRSKDPVKDNKNAGFLKTDPKNTAENLMIVDMVRNDLGRICSTDSIYVDPLFHVDSYATLHQMISTVHGKIDAKTTFSEIIQAVFPAASITGAPKIAAMRKIRQLEKSPRKIYTGSIACIYPNQDFCMNVAIRTLICNKNSTELGIGGGIVYDSGKAAELDEALLKSKFIHAAEPDFEILETMLFKNGISDLNEHLNRMAKSAEYFAFKFDKKSAGEFIANSVAGLETGAPGGSRIRLLLNFKGELELESFPLEKIGWGKDLVKIKLSQEHTSSDDIFLRHKTTRREFYNEQFKQAVDEAYDEVIFTNERGEISEGAISNIFIQTQDNSWYTPPLCCGLLPGIWCDATIKKLNAKEKILYPSDLKQAKQIIIGNSVRGEKSALI